MSKQTFPIVASEDVAWDAQLQDWQDIFSGKAYPLFDVANVAALPAANVNDDGLLLITADDGATHTGPILAYSLSPTTNAWKKLAPQTATLATLTGTAGGTANDALVSIPDPADTPASADALRDDLVANVLPVIRDDIDDVRAKLVALLAAMKTAGAMDD